MGLKKNVVYSGILTTSLYVFQFITYPYVARVLGVTNIGICNFAQSIVLYFSLFALLGTSALGVREIAKCKGDKQKQESVFSGILQLNILLMFLVVFAYLLAIELVPQLSAYRKLLYIGVFQIISNAFTIEWFFRGMEDFRYITLRTCLVRVLYVFSIFLFVRTESDYALYFFITVGLYVLNGLINWIYGRRFVRFKWYPVRSVIRQYMRPMCLLGAQSILTTMYTSFNIVYLGFVANDDQVGYYITATKIQGIILSLYTAFTMAMMPRVSAMLAEDDQENVRKLINASFSLLCAFAFPVIIFTEIFAPEIIRIIAGAGYEESIGLLRIAMPLILVIGLEQILIVQLLIPARADKAISVNSLIGAAVGISLNILLVGHLQSLGAVVVWIASESAVLASAYYFVRKRMSGIVDHRVLLVYSLSFVPLVAVCWILRDCFIWAILATVLYSHLNLYVVVRDHVYRSFWRHLRLALFPGKQE